MSSAGAVRQGKVFVEISADTKKFFDGVAKVNKTIGGLGSSMSSMGVRMAAAGGALFGPIAAAGAALAANTKEVEQSQQAIKGIGEAIGKAVAPAFVGMAKVTTRSAEALSKLIRDNPQAVRMIAALGVVLIGAGGSLKLFGSSVKLATELTGHIIKPLSTLTGAVIGLGKWFGTGAQSIAKGMASLASATINTTVGLVKMSIAGVRAAAALAASLAPAAARAAVALGRAVVSAASLALSLGRMGAALAVANPFAAVLVGLVAAIGVAMAVCSKSTQEAGEKAAWTGGQFAGLGKWVSGVFTSIKATIDSTNIGKAISDSVGSGLTAAAELFGELWSIADMTIGGVYNEIAAGDLAGAVDILWSGVQAAWTAGQSTIMGALDPWVQSVQNTMTDAGTGIAIIWDRAWTEMATSNWGQVFLGVMDNVINGVMAAWDGLVGRLQKGWVLISSLWTKGMNVEAEFKKIDAENASRAAERGQSSPGIEGRQSVDKDKLRKESEQRIAAMSAAGEDTKAGRAARTQQNVADRAAAAADAKAKLGERVRNTTPPPDVKPADAKKASEIVGTFSGLAASQMGTGGGGIQQKQLEELKKIAKGVGGPLGGVFVA